MSAAAVVESVSNEERLRTVKIFPSEEHGIECRFNRDGAGKISIFNPNDFKVAFKLKRTLPEFINVTPGYGYVRPQECKFIKVRYTVLCFTICSYFFILFFFAFFQVNVEKVKEEEAASHADHRISVLVCQAPLEAPRCAKDIWRTSHPAVTCKTRVPVKFVNKETPSSETKTSVSSSKTSVELEESSTTTTSSNPSNVESSDESTSNEKVNRTSNEEANSTSDEGANRVRSDENDTDSNTSADEGTSDVSKDSNDSSSSGVGKTESSSFLGLTTIATETSDEECG